MKKIFSVLSLALFVLAIIGGIFCHFKKYPSFRTGSFLTASSVLVSRPLPKADEVIRQGNNGSHQIVLSFDADMTEDKNLLYFHKEIVEILNKEKIPATFFLSGLWAETYPQAVKDIFSNDHFEIGSHSYSHLYFAKPCARSVILSSSQKEQEIYLAQKEIKNITGQDPKLFRFPGGCYHKNDLKLVKKYGLSVVHWSVDSKDAVGASKEEIIKTVKEETKGGSIILFHLHCQNTVEVLPEIINFLKKEGYVFVKIENLLKQLSF